LTGSARANDQGHIDQWYLNDPWQTDPSGTDALPVDVSLGGATGISFSLTRGHSISGTVTEAATGLPIPNVRIVVSDASGPEVACGRTDQYGAYSTEELPLPPGLYQVATDRDPGANPGYVPQWYTKDLSVHDYFQTDPSGTKTTWVEVVSANVKNIDFILTPGYTISGTVTDKDGKLIPNVGMQVYDAAGQVEVGVNTDEPGYYSTGALIPGSYKVRTNAEREQGYSNQWYSDHLLHDYCQTDPAGEQATPVDVSLGNAIDIDFILTPGYTISGTVTDSTNHDPLTNGIPEVVIRAFDESGNEVYLGKQEGFAGTDSHGIYGPTFALIPGLYTVRTENGLRYYLDQWYPHDLVQTDPSGTGAIPVDISSANATVDFSLAPNTPKLDYLHGTAPALTLNNTAPTGTTAKYLDSPAINRTAYKVIGTWADPVTVPVASILRPTPLEVWIGLKNSDDQGTYFDLKAEVLRNGVPVAEGVKVDIRGVTRNPDKALKVTIDLSSLDVFVSPGDTLSLRISAKVTASGGHNSAVGLRLYYDAVNRASSFGWF